MKRTSTIPRLCGLIVLICLLSSEVSGQESVVDLVQDNYARADEYFKKGSYQMAIDAYKKIADSGKGSAGLYLKIARAYYRLGKYSDAVDWCEKYMKSARDLTDDDRLMYASALSGVGRYDDAITQYETYSKNRGDDHWVQNRIWRLRNIHFLMEDSLQYFVRRLGVSSAQDDFAAVPYGDGIVFLSRGSKNRLVRKTDASTGQRFFQLMFSFRDSLSVDFANEFSAPRPLKAVKSKYHDGPICFYDGESRMVMTRLANSPNQKGEYKLGLYFAVKSPSGWTLVNEFPYNSTEWSNTDPYISPSGEELYFSSDRGGGHGGRDLYRSVLQDGKWQTPVNLGEEINTPHDERFPCVNMGRLYFSSNGQAGMGGFDIFRADILPSGFGEAHNMGYPLNSSADDLGLFLFDGGHRGYFTSRRNSEFGDDVFEVQIDQQRYPLTIQGVVKIKERGWSTLDSLKNMPGATIFLQDHTRKTTVEKTVADSNGRFSLNIPYFSFYEIRIVQTDGSEALISFEIPRKKKDDYFHEIVIVRDAFKVQNRD